MRIRPAIFGWNSVGLSACAFLVFILNAGATDMDGHKIAVTTWGPLINGIQLGYGFDHDEMGDPKSDDVMYEFQIRNDSKTERFVIEAGGQDGIHFFALANGVETELLKSNPFGLSHHFGIVRPNGVLHIYVSLPKTEVRKLVASSGLARVTVRQSQKESASPTAPVDVEVPLTVSD